MQPLASNAAASTEAVPTRRIARFTLTWPSLMAALQRRRGARRRLRVELVRVHRALPVAALEDAAHDDEEHRHEEDRQHGRRDHPAHHAGADGALAGRARTARDHE